MAKQMIAWTMLGVLLGGIILSGASRGAWAQDGLTDAMDERLWYHEAEFAATPGLRARPHHVVMLHLEPRGKRGKLIRNTIPFLFPETATFNFCVPQEDPHIRALELVREGAHGVVVHVPQGAPCKTRTIAAGLYQLHVDHDGTGVPAAGKKAFLHVPRFKAELGAGSGLGSFPSSCSNLDTVPVFTFTAPDGQFVSLDNTYRASIQSDTFGSYGWYICPDGSGNYTFIASLTQPHLPLFSLGPPSTNNTIFLNLSNFGASTPFKVTDLGNGQFTMAANFSGKLYPVVAESDGLLHWTQPGTTATVFTMVLKYYPPGTSVPPLQAREVAVFAGCNYDASDGTWIFLADSPSLFASYLDFSGAASVALGPGTPVTLYTKVNYSGTALVLNANSACLAGTPLGSNTHSLKLTPDRNLIAATNECQDCNLSGLDLSNLDLSGGQFQGSTFTGANLANSNFQSASLDRANLTGANTVLIGTNFLGALLHCTNFSGADLTPAVWQFGPVEPIVTTDFSCRLDLTGATLNLTSFPLTQWRYVNLTGATINGVTGATLSTITSPLDLSGAILNSVHLSQVLLDGANLGCAVNPDDASSVCTQLRDTVLTSASLQQAHLVDALMQGTSLDTANLAGANLCGARLNKSPITQLSATLEGTYLKNVNLAYADLTGATLNNANFYSSFAPNPSCLPAANCGPTPGCASAIDATLTSARFTGAYLNGVDFSGATLQSVDFSGAALVGVNFTGANLSPDSNNTGSRTDFTGAALQGATFTNANVEGASFNSAAVDLNNPRGATLLFSLDPKNTAFPGYQPAPGSTPGCVEFTYSHPTTVPGTDSTNLCPDGTVGACTTTQWQTPKTPPPSLPANCSTATVDFNWLFD
jgi:uncharacterized protein YjbI with pentapeptide repeats